MLKGAILITTFITGSAVADRDISKRFPISEGLTTYKAYMFAEASVGYNQGDYRKSYEWYTAKSDRLARMIEYKSKKLQEKIFNWDNNRKDMLDIHNNKNKESIK